MIFVDDAQSVQKWKADRSVPLAQVVSGFKIFVTHKYDSSSFNSATTNHSSGNLGMAPKERTMERVSPLSKTSSARKTKTNVWSRS